MAALTAIYRSESERSGLGQFGVDTVGYRETLGVAMS
jgi:hypothetical protein